MTAKKAKFKETVGIDIGSHSIKLIHLKPHHSGYRLLASEVRSTIAEGIEYAPSDLRPDRFAPVLAEMLRTARINPKRVEHLITAIGGDNTSIKQIKTIFLPDEELESALFFEAKKHLPISGSDMILDYQVINVEERTNNMNILLVAGTKELLNEHTQILADSGLIPGIVDVESLAVANCLALSLSGSEDGVYICLNIGAHRTNMVIWGPQSKFFARDISWGGYHFTQDIMKKKDISFELAEKQKIEYGISPEEAVKEGLSLSLDISEKSTEELLANEVKRSLRFYVKEAANSDFRKIFLMGGAAKTKGLAQYLKQNLNIETEIMNPFKNVEMSGKASGVNDPQFCLAMGLAMRLE